jgi:hypothetical protein
VYEAVAATCSGVPVATTLPGVAACPEVDDPVGRLDHVEVVLDDDHGVAGLHQAPKHLDEALHVGEVQAGGRLVEDVEGAPVPPSTARWRA